MSSSTQELFVDNSVLLDFCRPYVEQYEETEDVLTNLAVEKTISKFGGKQFNNQTSNRQQLLSHIHTEISEAQREYLEESESDLDEYVLENILTRDELEAALPFGLSDGYGFKIEELRDLFRELGPDEFLKEVASIQTEAMTQEEKIERKIVIDNRFEGRRNTMAAALLSDAIDNQIQQRVLVEAARWESKGRGDILLVSSSNEAYGRQGKINGSLSIEMLDFGALDFKCTEELAREIPEKSH